MDEGFNLSEKIVWFKNKNDCYSYKEHDGSCPEQGNFIPVKEIKEFIVSFEEYMNKKFLKEKETHKNHRVQALLLDLRAEFTERAGRELDFNGTKPLSEKECNILTKNYLESELQQAEWAGDDKIVIHDTGELKFEKGFFKEDIKETINKTLEKIEINFPDVDCYFTIRDIFKQNFGNLVE